MTISSRHYVYLHKDGEEVVYIGKGKRDRAYSYCSNRSPDHLEWMDSQLPFLKVEIKHSNLTSEEASKLETKLIKELQPRFNIQGTPKMPKNGEKKWIVNGEPVTNLVEWAREKGIIDSETQKGALYTAVKRGYSYKGYTIERQPNVSE